MIHNIFHSAIFLLMCRVMPWEHGAHEIISFEAWAEVSYFKNSLPNLETSRTRECEGTCHFGGWQDSIMSLPRRKRTANNVPGLARSHSLGCEVCFLEGLLTPAKHQMPLWCWSCDWNQGPTTTNLEQRVTAEKECSANTTTIAHIKLQQWDIAPIPRIQWFLCWPQDTIGCHWHSNKCTVYS
jgi:hypothetical protein